MLKVSHFPCGKSFIDLSLGETEEVEGESKKRGRSETREGGTQKMFHAANLLFFTLKENSMPRSDGRATVLASLKEAGSNKNPLGVAVSVCFFVSAGKEFTVFEKKSLKIIFCTQLQNKRAC